MTPRSFRPTALRAAAALLLAGAAAAAAAQANPAPAASAAAAPPVRAQLHMPAEIASSAAPAAAPLAGPPQSGLHYPVAPRKRVEHTYHGTTASDDFEWLENPADPATKAWVAEENKLSRGWLDAVPGRQALHDRFAALLGSTSNSYHGLVERGGFIYALKNQPPKQQALLVRLKSVDDTASEQVVFDPNALAANGSLAIDFFEPSLDGRQVAISVSEGGSEVGTLRVIDAATGKETSERIPRVAFPTGGGSVAWSAGNAGLYYTRYPAPGERPEADHDFFQQVWYHAMGKPVADDQYQVGKEFPRIGETVLKSSRDGRIVTAIVENGDGGEYALYAKVNNGAWQRIAAEADGVKAVQIGDDGALYLMSRRDAPRGKILRLAASSIGAKPVDWAHVPVLVAQSDGAIGDYAVSGGQLYVAELVGGPSRLRTVNINSRRGSLVTLPDVASVDELADLGRAGMLAQVSTYLAPTAWMHVVPGKPPRRSALFTTSDADFSDCEVVREFATSRDGVTKVPLNIIRRKGTHLDGRNPTILYGYGGYGVNETPHFNAAWRPWLERGGVLVIANLRGGGEYGDAWHVAGNLTRKQNVFDDFIASAQYLVDHKVTQPSRLGIMGGSNGGLLMGAVLTQRPDLFKAVSSSVGIYDMLRVELDPNGAFNVTEFGSVQDKAQFEALYAYSPLHHVKDGTKYPAVLMMTGDNDGRVNPAHSRKMIARLQAADPDGRPILLRTSSSSGHGIGTALGERVEQLTDMYGFLVDELMTP